MRAACHAAAKSAVLRRAARIYAPPKARSNCLNRKTSRVRDSKECFARACRLAAHDASMRMHSTCAGSGANVSDVTQCALALSESFSDDVLAAAFCESVNGSREYVALMMASAS